MDLIEKWKRTHQSICLIEHYCDDKKVASGTGFKIADKIVTNNHVYNCPSATHSLIKFVNQDSKSIYRQKKYDKQSFLGLLVEGDHQDNWDFAILALDDEFSIIPNLIFCKPEFTVEIGSQVYFLGFPLFDDNLMIHGGVISSKFIRSNVKYIQIDASVNAGNSGGALFDYRTDNIIGIVTRKKTGLTKKFDELKNSLIDNIRILENANEGITLTIIGINPIESLKIIQLQLSLLTDEISRSSNVGIGYAFELDEIRKPLGGI